MMVLKVNKQSISIAILVALTLVIYIKFESIRSLLGTSYYYDKNHTVSFETIEIDSEHLESINNEFSKLQKIESVKNVHHTSIWVANSKKFVQTRTKYAILSASVPNYANNTNFVSANGIAETHGRAWGYLFQIPNTARSWIKLGYTPVVMITIDYPQLTANAKVLLAIVEKEMTHVGATAFYFSVPSEMKVRLSQLLRLIPAALKIFPAKSFLVTSDADLWPVNPGRYNIKADKNIHITNHLCCGTFMFNNAKYREYPISTIAMTVELWNQLIPFQQFFIRGEFLSFDFEGFYKYLLAYCNGEDINSPATHGGMLWNLDQRYISIKINDHINSVGDKNVSYFPKFQCRRIDVSDLKSVTISTCLDDAHIYDNEPWSEQHWTEMNTLINLIYTDKAILDMTVYVETFRNYFNNFAKSKEF